MDVAVVGAGAAGLMAAVYAARQSGLPNRPRVLLLDRRQKIGAKILISGGTRCNVTNRRVLSSDYHGGPSHFVKHVLEAFTPGQTHEFFESIGVKLVLEPSGKYFPITHSGKTVLASFLKEAERLGVELKTGVLIRRVLREGRLFRLVADPEEQGGSYAKRVVIATGGLSYPETGSDGVGYRIAESFGHSVVRPRPALTPLTTDDEDWKSLSGVSLNVRLSFYRAGRKEAETEGPFLFTHFGFSGPAVLDISRFWTTAGGDERPRIEASFLPGENEASLGRVLEERRAESPQKTLKKLLGENFALPDRWAEVFLRKAGVQIQSRLQDMTRDRLQRFIHLLFHYPLETTGVLGYRRAEVTAGGVDLQEVSVQTMESKKEPGLYFAGEILDVDGRIGGFNFQWAWSSGALAGRAAAQAR